MLSFFCACEKHFYVYFNAPTSRMAIIVQHGCENRRK